MITRITEKDFNRMSIIDDLTSGKITIDDADRIFSKVGMFIWRDKTPNYGFEDVVYVVSERGHDGASYVMLTAKNAGTDHPVFAKLSKDLLTVTRKRVTAVRGVS